VDFGRDRDKERIPRYFSGREILRREYYYKTKVWTDFGRVRVRCHIQVHLSGNNILMVKPPLNYTSPPSMVATFLAIHLIAVLQPSRYSVFHDRDTPIQLSLL